MGHDINAIIGQMPINCDKLELYGLAVAFESNFAIVFLEQSHLQYWSKRLNLNYYSENEKLEFGNDLVHLFAKELGFFTYVSARLEYEFYGVLYENAVEITKGPINLMLQKLGVVAVNKQNEFQQLNLDDYRMSECYYWEGELNRANFHPNVVAGRIDI